MGCSCSAVRRWHLDTRTFSSIAWLLITPPCRWSINPYEIYMPIIANKSITVLIARFSWFPSPISLMSWWCLTSMEMWLAMCAPALWADPVWSLVPTTGETTLCSKRLVWSMSTIVVLFILHTCLIWFSKLYDWKWNLIHLSGLSLCTYCTRLIKQGNIIAALHLSWH